MANDIHVIKFKRIHFLRDWHLLSLTDQVFTYNNPNAKIAFIEVVYEVPGGTVETAMIETDIDTKAYVHLDVLHVKGNIKIVKGEKI